jgi:hypothetical protein
LGLEIKAEEVQEVDWVPAAALSTTSTTTETSTLTFAGVEFGTAGWRSSSAERPILHPQAVSSRREALQLAGTLLWEMRVRGLTLRSAPALRALYHRVAGGMDTDWESTFHLNKEEILGLEGIILLREERSWTKPAPARGPSTIVYAATDATNRSTAFIILPKGKEEPMLVKATTQDVEDVAVLELRAIVEAAREARTLAMGPIKVRVATDSAICAAIVAKGYSKSPALDDLLDELETMREGGLRVVATCGFHRKTTPLPNFLRTIS